MTNSTRLIESLRAAGTSRVARGQVLYQDRQLNGHSQLTGTRSQRQLVSELADLRPGRRVTYVHPGASAAGVIYPHEALQPADLIWLERVPRDPSAVPFEDARRIASIAQSLAQRQSHGSADRKLVESIWAPIAALHDRRQAEAQLANARQPLADLPASAIDALTDTYLEEVPDLTWEEARVRAKTSLQEVADARWQQKEASIELATRRLADIDQAMADRLSSEHAA